MKKAMPTNQITVFLLLLLFASQNALAKIHIPDELDDVEDDEEDQVWKDWGKAKAGSEPDFDPPPDPLKLTPEQLQTETMKRQSGPVFAFVKLQPGIERTKEMVSIIAMKWTKIARTGAIQGKFVGFDLGTIMVSMERGQDAMELKDFLLEQEDAYEVKMGTQFYRREGDPSFEELMEKKRKESKDQAVEASSKDDHQHQEL